MRLIIQAAAIVVHSTCVPGCKINVLTIFQPTKKATAALTAWWQQRNNPKYKYQFIQLVDGKGKKKQTFSTTVTQTIVGFTQESRLNVLSVALQS